MVLTDLFAMTDPTVKDPPKEIVVKNEDFEELGDGTFQEVRTKLLGDATFQEVTTKLLGDGTFQEVTTKLLHSMYFCVE